MKPGAGSESGAKEPRAIRELCPLDRHNELLVANVRPGDWENPEPAPRYNLVVVGGGTAGLVTAAGAAGLGAKVALVERHLLGGGLSELWLRALQGHYPLLPGLRLHPGCRPLRSEGAGGH